MGKQTIQNQPTGAPNKNQEKAPATSRPLPRTEPETEDHNGWVLKQIMDSYQGEN